MSFKSKSHLVLLSRSLLPRSNMLVLKKTNINIKSCSYSGCTKSLSKTLVRFEYSHGEQSSGEQLGCIYTCRRQERQPACIFIGRFVVTRSLNLKSGLVAAEHCRSAL